MDIGQNKDWSITDYEQTCQTTIDGKEYLTQITDKYYNNNKSIGTDKTLKNTNDKKWRGVFIQLIGIRAKKSGPGCDRHYNLISLE